MKKHLFASIVIFLMVLHLYAIPAAAEDAQTGEAIQPSASASQPTTMPTQASTEATQTATQSSQPSTESTTPSTESSQPPTESTTAPTISQASCTHTYGAWNTSETAHSRTCTKCNQVENSGHTWYSEMVTVAPTCKDGGGSAKVCTVCELILITEITPPLTTHTYTNACDTECNVCGVKREITHKYSAAWTKGGKGHWHVCTICGAAGEVKAHYPGPAATEEKEQICLTCGYVLMSKRGHVHKYSTQWSSDTAGHWHACDGCSELKEYAVHGYDDGCDSDCNICGYTRTEVHTYGTDWQQTETTHCGVCTACGKKGAVEEHLPDAAGIRCSICGYVITVIEETHIHSFDASVWGVDDAGHWHNCSCGERQQAAEHSWDTGRKMADSAIFTCTVCGAERQELREDNGIPWLGILIGFVMVAASAGIVVCIILLRKQGKYSR